MSKQPSLNDQLTEYLRRGYLELALTGDGEPAFMITPAGIAYAKEILNRPENRGMLGKSVNSPKNRKIRSRALRKKS